MGYFRIGKRLLQGFSHPAPTVIVSFLKYAPQMDWGIPEEMSKHKQITVQLAVNRDHAPVAIVESLLEFCHSISPDSAIPANGV